MRPEHLRYHKNVYLKEIKFDKPTATLVVSNISNKEFTDVLEILNNNHIDNLVIRSCLSKKEKLESFLVGLVDNKNISTLSFVANRYDAERFEMILEKVARMPVTYLAVEINAIDFSILQLGVPPIFYNFFQYNKTLTSLNLSRNLINSNGLNHFLKNIKYLQYLNLSHNLLKDAGAIIIGEFLAQNTSLTILDLEKSEIRSDGICAIANALTKNSTLTFLNLAENIAENKGAKAIFRALNKNSTLQELNLKLNQIECIDNVKINNSSLESLSLSGNILTFIDSNSLASNIKSLYLSSALIRKGKSNNIAEILSTVFKTSNLTTLDISYNGFMDGDLKKAVEGLKQTKIETLNLSNNWLPDEGLDIIGIVVTANNKLDSLDLRGNSFSKQGRKQFLGNLSNNHNHSLLSLYMGQTESVLSEIDEYIKILDLNTNILVIDGKETQTSLFLKRILEYQEQIISDATVLSNLIEDKHIHLFQYPKAFYHVLNNSTLSKEVQERLIYKVFKWVVHNKIPPEIQNDIKYMLGFPIINLEEFCHNFYNVFSDNATRLLELFDIFKQEGSKELLQTTMPLFQEVMDAKDSKERAQKGIKLFMEFLVAKDIPITSEELRAIASVDDIITACFYILHPELQSVEELVLNFLEGWKEIFKEACGDKTNMNILVKTLQSLSPFSEICHKIFKDNQNIKDLLKEALLVADQSFPELVAESSIDISHGGIEFTPVESHYRLVGEAWFLKE